MLFLSYISSFIEGYKGYANFVFTEITQPSFHNYFYWLLAVSAFFFALELVSPWRQKQETFRKDFWLDFFYMFFNFFLFSLIIYNAASSVVVDMFHDVLAAVGLTNLVALQVENWPVWAHLLLGFLVRDFVQWWIHRLLHWSPFLWKFHKVHHSVEQMGFAAHLRYHWMENVVYRSLEYIPLALIGIGLNDFFIIHIFTLAVGHYNHSNISIQGRYTAAVLGLLIGLYVISIAGLSWTSSAITVLFVAVACSFVLGPYMKYLFNSPEMHIWHHAYELPDDKPYGVNFGLTLAIWDYLFGTAHVPHDGRDIRLGFPGIEQFPDNFIEQSMYGTPIESKESVS